MPVAVTVEDQEPDRLPVHGPVREAAVHPPWAVQVAKKGVGSKPFPVTVPCNIIARASAPRKAPGLGLVNFVAVGSTPVAALVSVKVKPP